MILVDLWPLVSHPTLRPHISELLKAFEGLVKFLMPQAKQGKVPPKLPMAFARAITPLPKGKEIVQETENVLQAWRETLRDYPGEEKELVPVWISQELVDEIVKSLKAVKPETLKAVKPAAKLPPPRNLRYQKFSWNTADLKAFEAFDYNPRAAYGNHYALNQVLRSEKTRAAQQIQSRWEQVAREKGWDTDDHVNEDWCSLTNFGRNSPALTGRQDIGAVAGQ